MIHHFRRKPATVRRTVREVSTSKVDTRNDLLDILPLNMIWAEIGVFKGEFSDEILRRAEPNQLYLVDPWEGRWCNGGKDGDHDEWIEDLSQEFHKLQVKYASDPRVVIYRNTSDEFFHYMTDKHLDAVYIDGLHDYESVKKDLNNAFRVTRRFILGHDYISPRFDGVVKAVDEFCRDKHLNVTMLTKDGCPSYLIKL